MTSIARNGMRNLFDLLAATLTTFHGWGAPWWLSVVMLTFAVWSLPFPLTFRQAKNMRNMQQLKPEMDRLRKEHKDDTKKQQEELLRNSTGSARSTP